MRVIQRHDKATVDLRQRDPQLVSRLARADDKAGRRRSYRRQRDFLERVRARQIERPPRRSRERADDIVTPFGEPARQTDRHQDHCTGSALPRLNRIILPADR